MPSHLEELHTQTVQSMPRFHQSASTASVRQHAELNHLIAGCLLLHNGMSLYECCALQEVDVQLDEAREKLQTHAAELEEANRAMTLLRGDVQKLDAKRAHLR